MRQTFGPGVSLLEQRIRVADAKTPGRKHQKRPGVRANERKKATRKRAAKLKAERARALKDRIAAYWAGELDQYPVKDDL